MTNPQETSDPGIPPSAAFRIAWSVRLMGDDGAWRRHEGSMDAASGEEVTLCRVHAPMTLPGRDTQSGGDSMIETEVMVVPRERAGGVLELSYSYRRVDRISRIEDQNMEAPFRRTLTGSGSIRLEPGVVTAIDLRSDLMQASASLDRAL